MPVVVTLPEGIEARDAAVRLAVEHGPAAEHGYARELLTLNTDRIADLLERAGAGSE